MKTNTYLMKSNNKNRYIPLCVAAFSILALFAACDRNETEPEQKTEGPETACVELDQIGMEGSVLSRATDVPTDGTIGFYRNAVNGYSAVTNVTGTWKKSTVTGRNAWIPTSEMIKVGTDDATMAIYYPHVKSNDGNPDFIKLYVGQLGKPSPVESTFIVQETWSKRFNYNSLSSYTTAFNVGELKHVYSKLKIILERKTGDNGFVGSPEWTKVTLLGGGIKKDSQFYLFRFEEPALNSYDLGHVPGKLEIPLNPKNEFSGNSSEVELLLIPGNISGDITITITLGGKDMDVKIPNASFDGQFAPGKQYNLTITVNPTDLEVASLKTTDWTNVTVPGQSTH